MNNLMKIFKIYSIITTGLVMAVQDDKITLDEIIHILVQVLNVLNINLSITVPENLKAITLALADKSTSP